MQILLSNSQAGPGRTVKQEKDEISRNHVQAFLPGPAVCCLRREFGENIGKYLLRIFYAAIEKGPQASCQYTTHILNEEQRISMNLSPVQS